MIACLFIEYKDTIDLEYGVKVALEERNYKFYDATADESAICSIKGDVDGIKAFYEKLKERL